MEKNMTVGNPMQIILNFTIPVFIGNVFQQFYSMVDTIIVGQFVGTKALAAVGSTGTIMFLIIGFLLGLTTGITVLTAQRFGVGDMDAMRRTVGSAGTLSIIISILMTIISMLGMKPLLHLMNTPADIFEDAYTYIMIICAGIFAQVLYMLLASILRALGNSKTPLYFLIISAVLNIILDLILIINFHMGVAGAAYATVISQGVSGILCILYIIKKVPILHLKKDDWKLRGTIVKNQLGIGLPMAFQYSITAIGTTMVQSALNGLGSTYVAAFTAASKIEQMLSQAFVSLGVAISTFAAQNMGAGKKARIRQGFAATTKLGVIYSIFSMALIMLVGKYMTLLFVSENVDQIMKFVDIYLKCAGIFFIPLALVNIYRNGIQGMGYGLLPMTAGIAELVGRGVVAVVAASLGSYLGICLASPAAWVLATILLLVTYFYIVKDYPRHELFTKPLS
ncbi:MAG: MATE family efflux transporter [Hespellia sp.]|nr:MATE family efflux transporter [Hespellia sp.]